MAKKRLKELAQKALESAGENLQKAGAVAKKAAAGVNDEIDEAKVGIQKATLANRLAKNINVCIKALEKENKANSTDAIHECTELLTKQLEDLSGTIKNDPYECRGEIESEINRIVQMRKDMIESSKTNEEMLEMTVMSKRYGEAIQACQETIAVMDELKAADKE